MHAPAYYTYGFILVRPSEVEILKNASGSDSNYKVCASLSHHHADSSS